jgi:hypothetical protein
MVSNTFHKYRSVGTNTFNVAYNTWHLNGQHHILWVRINRYKHVRHEIQCKHSWHLNGSPRQFRPQICRYHPSKHYDRCTWSQADTIMSRSTRDSTRSHSKFCGTMLLSPMDKDTTSALSAALFESGDAVTVLSLTAHHLTAHIQVLMMRCSSTFAISSELKETTSSSLSAGSTTLRSQFALERGFASRSSEISLLRYNSPKDRFNPPEFVSQWLPAWFF